MPSGSAASLTGTTDSCVRIMRNTLCARLRRQEARLPAELLPTRPCHHRYQSRPSRLRAHALRHPAAQITSPIVPIYLRPSPREPCAAEGTAKGRR